MNRKPAFTLIELLIVLTIIVTIVAITIGSFGGLITGGTGYLEERTATIEPIRLYTIPSSSGTSYRCFAKVLRADEADENLDAETTFEIMDSVLKSQYRSADLYGKLREGEVFDITYYGIRSGYLNQFPRIIEVGGAKADSDGDSDQNDLDDLDDLYD